MRFAARAASCKRGLKRVTPSRLFIRSQCVVMACKRYTVNEVVAELDGSDFEDSEDDFVGIWT